MKELLKFIVELIARIHDKILSINDGHSFGLNDKQLHLVVIGLLGFGIFLVVHTVFKWLSKRSITAISWIYTCTLVVVITFAIEIGQYATNSGDMSFADIAYGIWGFLVVFIIYLVVRGVLRGITHFGRKKSERTDGKNRQSSYIGQRRR